MVVGGRAAVRGAQKLAFMWFMNEHLGGMAHGTGPGCFLPRFWGLGGPMEMRPQMHLCWVCTLSHPLLLKPPPQKGMSRGPRDQLNNLGEAVPRADFIP